MGVKICTYSPTTISGSMSKDSISLSSMPPCFPKPSESSIPVKNDEGLKAMADSRKIVYPPPLISAPLSKSVEKRGRGRPRGSKNKDPYRPYKPPANGAHGNQIVDPNAISLHDIGPAASHEDGNKPSTSTGGSGTSAVRTKEFDYRRKVHERLSAMMQNEHSKVLCLLPEVENTTTSQMSIFIRRLRTQFWPEGSKKSSEIPTKPKMPTSVAEPLYGALCEDLDAFRKSSCAAQPKIVDSSKTSKNWQLDPDLTDESCDSSGDEFTEDEVEKQPTKKRRCITRSCSDFKYYGLKRDVLEAKDMLKQAKEEKQRQIKQLKATLESTVSKKEPFELAAANEETEEESDSARCRPLKNWPERDITKLVTLPTDTSSEVLDIERAWHGNVSCRLSLPQEFAPVQSQISNFCRQAANTIPGFEARRRNRKLVRSAMIAKKRGQFVPNDYILLKRQEELWKTRKRVIKQRPVARAAPSSTLSAVSKRKIPEVESDEEPYSEDSDYDYEEGMYSRRSKSGKSKGRSSKTSSSWALNGVRRTSNAGKWSSKRQSIGFKESEFEFDDQMMDTTIKQVDYKEIDVPTWRCIDMDSLYPDYPQNSCTNCTGDKQNQPLSERLDALHRNLELAEKRRLYS